MSGPDAGARGHRGSRAIQRLIEFAPATGALALWVRHRDLSEADRAAVGSNAIAPLTTDGHTLFYVSGFEKLPLADQCGWVAHAVLHVALRHPQRFRQLQGRTGEADLALFNACADAIVNSTLDHLDWLRLPAEAARLDTLLRTVLAIDQPLDVSLREWDVERLYSAVDDRRRARTPGQRRSDAASYTPASRAKNDGTRARRVRALCGPAQADLLPGAAASGSEGARSRAATPEGELEQAREWRERLVRAHAQDGRFSLMRSLMGDLASPRMPWEQVLRTRLARALSRRPALSWSRPSRSYLANQGRAGANRRLPWEPGTVSSRAVPALVVVIDVSGSIQTPLLERFAGEIEAIGRRLEARLTLVVGDDQVRQVMRCEPGASGWGDIAILGGGGTDFTPLLEEAARHRPDIVVVLTDLQGPAGWRPPFPVLWTVPDAYRDARVPFGRKLVLD